MLQSKESIGVAAAFAFSGILISLYQVRKLGTVMFTHQLTERCALYLLLVDDCPDKSCQL